MKYSGTAGKPGGKQRTQSSSYSQGSLQSTRTVGFWYTEIGALNQVVHMWVFEDLNQRATQRQKFYADPALANVFPKLREVMVKQESKILMQPPFHRSSR
jgi:hypothetical protein